ncbi:MAG: biotin-dependent carboxyltransferase family protein [Actinobacteria bacterium]|nr:biotin-dependent carboxyltransferase family protein [Actinomycetota bacterium]
MITVRSWGIAGRVVDGGRAGLLSVGISRGGAVDTESLALANRLVGNAADTCALETSGGMTLEFGETTAIAVTGAVAEIGVSAGPPVGWGTVAALPAGSTLRVGRVLDGARVYVAVHGGLSGDAEVGRLGLGPDPGVAAAALSVPRPAAVTSLRVWPGPRIAWFVEGTWQRLCTSVYVVTDTNRVGTRLIGPPLELVRRRELPSEGLVEGAIQVPVDGQPIIMLADHPTTGGYPVIAVVDPADVHHAAQAAPGTELRFTACA